MNNKVVNDVRAQGAKNQPKYKGVLNFMNTAICPRMLIQSKVSMHVETAVLLSQQKPDE